MREFNENLAGKELSLAANFKASLKIAKKVGDPVMIAREANLEAMFLAQGMPYTPRWEFSVENIPELIHIGVEAGGGKESLEDIQALVFEAGFAPARDFALEYLALIIGPSPEEDGDGGESSEGN